MFNRMQSVLSLYESQVQELWEQAHPFLLKISAYIYTSVTQLCREACRLLTRKKGKKRGLSSGRATCILLISQLGLRRFTGTDSSIWNILNWSIYLSPREWGFKELSLRLMSVRLKCEAFTTYENCKTGFANPCVLYQRIGQFRPIGQFDDFSWN